MAGYVAAEDLLIDWFRTKLGYANVTDELPSNLVDLLRTNPVIVIDRFGGNDNTITIDIARVDIDVYANNRAAAKVHGETIRGALRSRLRGHVYQGTAVGKVETLGAPTIAPYDSRHNVRRVTAAYQVTLHQFSGVT